MQDQPNLYDPFDLEGKNLKRVIPAVRRNIHLQRQRMIGHVITFFVCLAIAILGWRSPGFWRVLSIGFALMIPFSLVGFFADRHLKRWNEARLAECERRLTQE